MGSIDKRDQFEGYKHHCIWMQAGVVPSKFCGHDYNCRACRFDSIMKKVSDENRKEREAAERSLHRPGRGEPC